MNKLQKAYRLFKDERLWKLYFDFVLIFKPIFILNLTSIISMIIMDMLIKNTLHKLISMLIIFIIWQIGFNEIIRRKDINKYIKTKMKLRFNEHTT